MAWGQVVDELELEARGLVTVLRLAAWRIVGAIALIVLTADGGRSQALVTADISDFRFMVQAIAEGHANPYHTITEPELGRLAASIEAGLTAPSKAGVMVGFSRLAAAIGDGHTRAPWPLDPAALGLKQLPLRIEAFAEGYFVVAVERRHVGLLGARLTRVGGVEIDEVVRRLRPIISRDNEHGVPRLAKRLLTLPEILHFMKIGRSPERAQFDAIERDGRALSVVVEASPSVNQPLLTEFHDHVQTAAPANWSARDQPYSSRRVTDRVVYAQINQSANATSGRTLPEFCEELLTEVARAMAERIILDLRFNTGGSRELLLPCVDGLAGLHRTGGKHVTIALIGRDTFSAGLWTAIDLRDKAGAFLVGEPTSGRPNFYGETRSATTPNLKLRFTYSSRFNQRTTPADRTDALYPQVLVRESFDDFAAGRDAGLERALRVGVAR